MCIRTGREEAVRKGKENTTNAGEFGGTEKRGLEQDCRSWEMKQKCSRRRSSRQACGVNCGNRVLKGPHHDSEDSVEADSLLTWLH